LATNLQAKKEGCGLVVPPLWKMGHQEAKSMRSDFYIASKQQRPQ